MKLIVGLGNPGQEYQNSKHNMGFMCLDQLCHQLNISLDKSKFNGIYYQGFINNEKIIFLKPLTYMNLSGECVGQFVKYFKIELSDILVIYDDMDTKIGNIRIRAQGSSGGQNGMKNIIDHLGTKNISRIRIGIGRNLSLNSRNYVLSSFSLEEKEKINQALDKATKAALDFITSDINNIMNKYNQRD